MTHTLALLSHGTQTFRMRILALAQTWRQPQDDLGLAPL
jgi:hypothetical protein